MDIRTPERLVLLAAAIATTSIIILFIDVSIKNGILKESRNLRAEIGLRRDLPTNIHLQNKPRDDDGIPAGGIKRAPFIFDPDPSRHLHGDRSYDEGFGDPNEFIEAMD